MATIQVDLVDAARAVRPDLHRRERASRSARSRSTAPSTARWSGSSASSSSTSPGAFPLWLAPVQAVVIPIADRHIEAADGAGRRSCARAACASRSTTRRTGCRTRSALAQEQKVPYMVVLGDREIEARTASPRTRAGRAAGARRRGRPSPTGSPPSRAARGPEPDRRVVVASRNAVCYPPASAAERVVVTAPVELAWTIDR